MSDATRLKAEATLRDVEAVTAVILPEPSTELVPLAKAKKPVAEAIKTRMDEIDISDTQSIVSFGSGAQVELQEISQAIYELRAPLQL